MKRFACKLMGNKTLMRLQKVAIHSLVTIAIHSLVPITNSFKHFLQLKQTLNPI